MSDERLRKNIIKILIVFSCAFLLLIGYLSYYNIRYGESLVSNPYNKRLKDRENEILRGSIYDRDMTLIVNSQRFENNSQKRVYNEDYSMPYAATLGYYSSKYGTSGLEQKYADVLLDEGKNPLKIVKDLVTKTEKKGNNLVLTTNSELMKTAYDALGNNRGALVAMDPKTGEVLAMVSKPVFNPSTIDKDWPELVKQNEDGPFINRATQPKLYPPGSIFKVIVAGKALENIEGIENNTFNCSGNLAIGNYTLSDYGTTSHGKLNLHDALVYSCNVTFGQIGMELGADALKAGAEDFLFNRPVDYFDLPTNMSKFPDIDKSRQDSLAQSAIGQFEVTVTPLEMAMVVSSIANDGVMMRPYLVKSITDKYDDVVSKTEPEILARPLQAETTKILTDMMVDVVKKGTGKNAQVKGIDIAGKTGTAEVGKNVNPHSWFIAFAPADNPKIAISVIVENGESGGGKAASVAKKVIEAYLK